MTDPCLQQLAEKDAEILRLKREVNTLAGHVDFLLHEDCPFSWDVQGYEAYNNKVSEIAKFFGSKGRKRV